MKTIVLAVIALSLIIGCSLKINYAPMVKDGVDPMQAKKDSYECKKETAAYRGGLAAGSSGGHVGVINQGTGVIAPGPAVKMHRAANEQAEEFYVECMELKGYKKTE